MRLRRGHAIEPCFRWVFHHPSRFAAGPASRMQKVFGPRKALSAFRPRQLSSSVEFLDCIGLAQLGGRLASECGMRRRHRHGMPTAALSRYWTASRCRSDLWHRSLGRHRHAAQSGDPAALEHWWMRHGSIVAEIIVSELLSRVVAAVANLNDVHTERDEAAPVAEAVYQSHLEVCNRVHRAMLDRRGLSPGRLVRFQKLRRSVDRWGDELLAVCVGVRSPHSLSVVLPLASDQDRVRAAALDRAGLTLPIARLATELMIASMVQSLESQWRSLLPSPVASRSVDWNFTKTVSREVGSKLPLPTAAAGVAQSVLGLWPIDFFDDIGFPVGPAMRWRDSIATGDGDTHPDAEWQDVEWMDEGFDPDMDMADENDSGLRWDDF